VPCVFQLHVTFKDMGGKEEMIENLLAKELFGDWLRQDSIVRGAEEDG